MSVEGKKLRILQKFKDSLIEFLDELIEQFPTQTELVVIRVMVKDQIPTTQVIDELIVHVLPFKDKIRGKDLSFLEDEKERENHKHSKIIKMIEELWNSDTLDEDDNEQLFNWVLHFLKLTEKYDELKNAS